MEFPNWCNDHPWMTFIFACLALVGVVELLLKVFFVLPNRLLRHLSMRKNGWPPEHCDADGDLKTENRNA